MIRIESVGAGTESVLSQASAQQQKAQEQPVTAIGPVAQATPVKADTFIADSGNHNIEAQFSVDPDTHETVVRVVDASTQEVIRELPPEAIRSLSKTLAQYVGKQMDTRA